MPTCSREHSLLSQPAARVRAWDFPHLSSGLEVPLSWMLWAPLPRFLVFSLGWVENIFNWLPEKGTWEPDFSDLRVLESVPSALRLAESLGVKVQGGNCLPQGL